MKRILIILSLVFVLAPSTAQSEEGVSFQVLIDNSAAMQDQEEASQTIRLFMHQLAELRSKSSSRKAAISIISINNPRNLWHGTPRELYRNGKEVLKKIATVENGCSDIAGALEQARMNLESLKASKAYILVFSSLIHTGSPCDDSVITLPQAAPELELSFIKEMDVRFYWVHHLQRKPWMEMLKKHISSFQMHDQETTKAVLKREFKL